MMSNDGPVRLLLPVPAIMLVAVLTAPVAAGEIYRCDGEGVTEFSDTPCHEDAEVHVSGNHLSIVTPPDLSAVAEQNRAWIQRQQERMDQRARQRDARRNQPPAPPARTQWPAVPVFGFFPHQGRHPPRDRGREERREETEERFSALSGRQPGARPRRDDP